MMDISEIEMQEFLHYLELRDSGESVEDLLSGGADIDALIAAGILSEDRETAQEGQEPLPHSTLHFTSLKETLAALRAGDSEEF